MFGATTRRRIAVVVLIAATGVAGCYAQSRLLARQRCVRIIDSDPRPATAATSSPRSQPSIRIGTYNIAHARGGEFGASNWTGASREEVRSRLAKIAHQVSDAGVEVLVLNEVDFDASWSRSVDEAVEIARSAGLRYVAEQRNIDVTLPFRTFRFGNAILSRYPIAMARAVHFRPFSRLEAVVAGNHDGLVAEVLTPLGRIDVFAVHLEYRSETVRLQSARIVEAFAERASHPMIVVGDFNSIPRFARKHPDYVPPPETALDFLLGAGKLSVTKTPVDWNRYVTFPSASPDRAIDWILTTPDLDQGLPSVVQSDLSDHLMVTVPISAAATKE